MKKHPNISPICVTIVETKKPTTNPSFTPYRYPPESPIIVVGNTKIKLAQVQNKKIIDIRNKSNNIRDNIKRFTILKEI